MILYPAPDWLQAYATYCRDLVGVYSYHLYVYVVDRPPGTSSEKLCDGSTLVDSEYRVAQIFVRYGIPHNRAWAVIFHEMFHVALGDLQDLLEETIQDLPRSKRSVYQRFSTVIVEQFIQVTTRAISWHLDIPGEYESGFQPPVLFPETLDGVDVSGLESDD